MEETQRGIAILARGKLIQEPSFFDVSGGQQYAWAYMVGELNAEFFDATDGEDLVGTNRSSIIWESEAGIAFRNWAQSKLKSISQDWAARRAEKREKVIREDSEFKPWLSSLSGPEKKVADKIIQERKACIVVVNKWDLMDEAIRKARLEEIDRSTE